MRLEKIKHFIFQFREFLGLGVEGKPLAANNIATKKTVPENPNYPPEFVSSAQELLDNGFLPEFADLLAHHYKPSKAQQKQWSRLVMAEIDSKNFVAINALIKKGYEFTQIEAWRLFELAVQNSYEGQQCLQYIKKNLDNNFSFILEKIEQKITNTSYRISFDAQYPSTSEGRVEDKAKIIAPHNSQLQNLWFLTQSNSKYLQPLLNVVNYQEQTLIEHYAEHVKKYSFFYSIKDKISGIQNLKNEILNTIRNAHEHKDKVSGMKEFLKQQHLGEKMWETAQAIKEQTALKKYKLEPHIQKIVEQISSFYATLSQSRQPEIVFESKNVVEKTVPQLLAVYLSFPENYRKTFKNDNNQTPEDLLIIGLTQQRDILHNFETMALKEKAKEMETLNLYGHNKKMSLGK